MTRPVDPIAGKTADPACGWCHGRGWSIAADRPEIERCDACAVFVDDEHAGRNAARWVALREGQVRVLDYARLAAEEAAREAWCEASALRTLIRLSIERLEGAERVDGKRIRAERRGDA